MKKLTKPKRIWHSFLPHEWDALMLHGYTPKPIREVRADHHGQLWEFVSSGIKVLAKLKSHALN